ncbi:helix-turn-helix domain-containing protein [Kribbella sp. NPDC049227]|uniref:AraC-like ligand-binding domain-containing protein n=1 Tax=Kribbella sp. NPDC049227 TaxID=3364113 RepID=UPI003720977E
MTTVWRADDQPPAARMEYISHAVSNSLVPFELRPKDLTGFRCEIRTADIGALRFVDISAPDSEAVRGARLIRRSDPELCTVHVQLRGHPVVEQGDRQAVVHPGDLAFVDLSRPTRVAGSAHRQVSVMFPRALLPLSRGDTRDLVGVRLPGRRGCSALVAGLVRQMADNLDEYAGAARIGAAVLDLTTATLAAWTGRDALAPAQQRHVLLLRIEAFIEQHLGDPNLTPGMVAAAHHISPRYLYRLFEPRATSVAGLIRARRLERCRRDLIDPANAWVPASAIGSRWGFPDPARFSRVFRVEYGVPPGEYRRLSLPTD